jgi:hypothetical protein
MDGAENGLTVLLQLVQEIENSPRGLRVQSRGGFVQEEKKSRLSSQFHTDGKTLALLNVETFTGDTDDGISVFSHLQKLDNLLDVFDLLLTRDVCGLTEDGGEGEGFTDGRGGEMEILLLSVT